MKVRKNDETFREKVRGVQLHLNYKVVDRNRIMAASIIMETLKQIQCDLTDQKEYIRNLHVIHKTINEKYDLQGNLSDLHKKIDHQQLTMERLEQQIKKNNMFLFGNDDFEINFENKNMLKKSDYYEKDKKNYNGEIITTESGEQFEKCAEYSESNQPQNTPKEADTQERKMNFKEDDKNDVPFQENNEDTGDESSSNYDNNNEQFQEENNGEDTGEEFTSNEIREIKELIKEYVATKRASTEEIRPVRKEKAVKISPTYLSEDQISKLNEELYRITGIYRSTDIFPIIKVVPGPHKEHPIITKLRKGVTYDAHDKKTSFSIKFGIDGYKISEVRELLTEYPDLLLFDVVRKMLISKNKWSNLCKQINFDKDMPYRRVL